MNRFNLILLFIASIFISCKNSTQQTAPAEVEGRVPVTVTSVQTGLLQEVVSLNAVSVFRMKSNSKASITGYLSEVNISPGEKVIKGKTMFVIRSKEAQNIGNTINQIDSSFHFNGLVPVLSPITGYIIQQNYQVGDFVQEGEQLATLADANSLVFQLELPYELRPYLPLNKTVELFLPDGENIKGVLSLSLPTVDPVAQTQQYLIRISTQLSIPENLIARVNFIKQSEPNAVTIPKDAVLTNEIQSEYWIMKMINDSTAVKVLVKKGIETDDRVELVSPLFTPDNRILVTGNYGLPDTAQVKIVNDDKQ
jgi:multidrug efflux pump subunit AcrA (membrane-fusion protein)